MSVLPSPDTVGLGPDVAVVADVSPGAGLVVRLGCPKHRGVLGVQRVPPFFNRIYCYGPRLKNRYLKEILDFCSEF